MPKYRVIGDLCRVYSGFVEAEDYDDAQRTAEKLGEPDLLAAFDPGEVEWTVGDVDEVEVEANPRRAAVATGRLRAEALALMESQVEILSQMVGGEEREIIGAAGFLWGMVSFSRSLGLISGDTAALLENVAEALHDQAIEGRWPDFRDTLHSASNYLDMLAREVR